MKDLAHFPVPSNSKYLHPKHGHQVRPRHQRTNHPTTTTTHLTLFTTLLIVLTSTLLPNLAAANPNPDNGNNQNERPSSKEYTNEKSFKSATLNLTNVYRKQHNATSLTWNDTLAEFAQDVSDTCVFEHSGGPYGENLASGYPNATASIIAWGHERVDYDFKKQEFTHETGHFTQLVWKGTSSMGCARTECNYDYDGDDKKRKRRMRRDDDDGEKNAPGWYVVCEYYPAGNVMGQFEENVQARVEVEDQPEGPSHPLVPDEGEGEEECPQGGVCSAGHEGLRVGLGGGGKLLGLWVAIWVIVWL